MTRSAGQRDEGAKAWTFFTNHALVLLCLARDPRMRLREVADLVGITERTVQRIVSELETSGYLRILREGRRNRYRVVGSATLRHPLEGQCKVGDVIECVLGDE
ncbi:MAG: winged helix-turn-helix domain-containing protein [Sandaracinaceae bacterium]|nr:winged helix-turn-helix domain-containing protein [Sandaracinaceae bacterium]